MRKDDAQKRRNSVKHSRNSQTGKRGHNKRVRKNIKSTIRKDTDSDR